MGGDPEMVNSLTELIFSRLDPLYEFHTALLKEIDQRVTAWYDLCVCLCVCECVCECVCVCLCVFGWRGVYVCVRERDGGGGGGVCVCG